MILLIDNYDSFTYNLVDLLARFVEVKTVRNDAISLIEIENMQPQAIVISPGPGKPKESGISYQVVQHFWGKLPILGVCLGHQIIGEISGASVVLAEKPMHGKVSLITHHQKGLFTSMKSPIQVMRYHSLVIKNGSLPDEMEVRAWADNEEIMAIQHKHLPIAGVQFHPESILSECGERLIMNWLHSFLF